MKAIVLDFDGTMTRLDVGDELCERFAPPVWRDIDEKWLRGELSLPEAQRQMWSLTRGSLAAMKDHARAVGTLRPGVESFVRTARARGHRVVIASGGFDFYIQALCEPFLHLIDDVVCNAAEFAGDRMTPVFCTRGVSCARCAVCKGQVCAAERSRASEVLFVGDGSSDRCVLGCESFDAATPPPRTAVVRGSRLHVACNDRGVPHLPFDDFGELHDWL